MAVYFAEAGGYTKIGYSGDPTGRAASVTTNGKRPVDLPRGARVDLIGWVPGSQRVESAWHGRFINERVAGEWFRIDRAEIVDAIWSDPRGVVLERMAAMAVFACAKYPGLTRDAIEAAGIPVLAAAQLPDVLAPRSPLRAS